MFKHIIQQSVENERIFTLQNLQRDKKQSQDSIFIEINLKNPANVI